MGYSGYDDRDALRREDLNSNDTLSAKFPSVTDSYPGLTSSNK